MSMPRLLSKTRLMRGYRCLKNVYLNIHTPSLEAPISEAQQALFDQGNVVGAAARERFPGGVLIDNKAWDFIGSLKATREHLSNRTQIIYEAAFEHRGCYARADIIRYSPNSNRWTIFEVKSSTKVKPEHIDDVGLQAWIIANAGLPIERICILHLNAECRFPNIVDLFCEVDLTDSLRERYPQTTPKIQQIIGTIQQPSAPEVDIGPHCYDPIECGFREVCWKEKSIPEISVFDLPNLKDKKWEWYSQGKIALADLPADDLNDLQKRMVRAHETKARVVNHDGIRAAMSSWNFPLVFLDFETINPAIPRYNNCGPYDHTPFQYSVHIWPSPGSEIEHREFLHCDTTDPRPALIPKLIVDCAGSGSVVSYYSRFESDRIKELIEFDPDSRVSLEAIISRMVDPLPVVREHVYDPGFKGRFSLKATAPALLGNSFSYDEMAVPDGTASQRAWEKMLRSNDPQEKIELKNALLEYCKKDTFVMVEMVKWLFANCGGGNTGESV